MKIAVGATSLYLTVSSSVYAFIFFFAPSFRRAEAFANAARSRSTASPYVIPAVAAGGGGS